MSERIDEEAVGERYAEWFSRGPRGAVMRYLFSPRGLWILNTPYRRILAAARITGADRVLDLGCGIGNILIALCQRVSFTTPPVGVDVSPVLIDIGTRELARAGLSDQVELLVAPATHLPFPDGRFDVVLTSHVVKHLDDLALSTAFSEVARVLRPGGRFLMWEFKKSPLSAPLFWSARTSGLPPPFKLRDATTLAQALTHAGFAQVGPISTGVFLVPPVPRMALLAER